MLLMGKVGEVCGDQMSAEALFYAADAKLTLDFRMQTLP
jgi:hypothetical protein